MMYLANESRYQTMRYNRCGNSGLLLPAVSLGLWHNFGGAADYDNMKNICFAAFDHGITHFDLANNYGPPPGGAEISFGKILQSELKQYRDELIISTKAGYTMWEGPYGDWGSRKYLLASLDQSLKRMGLDYVDIFYHHRMDPKTPLEETMMALDTAVKSGKALYAGISNYDRDTTQRAMAILRELRCPFVINQIRYSMLDRHIEDDGLTQYAADNGCGLIAFSPLAQGLLTNRYLNEIPADSRMQEGKFLKKTALTPQLLNKIQQLNALAEERGQTLAQMALSWVLHNEAITSVLIGASRPEQVLDNCKIVSQPGLTQQECGRIDRIIAQPDPQTEEKAK